MDLRTLLIRVGFSTNKASINKVEQDIDRAKKGLKVVGDQAENAGSKINALWQQFGALAAFSGMTLGLKSIIDTVDEWKVIEGQVNNVTKSQKESKNVQEEIYNIASRTRQKYQSTAELFTSVARNAESLKKDNKEILTFTEDVANAMLLGGGSDASQQAALVQLGQALGSGVLRGDELNSILEQAPRLAKAIAEGMGTTIGNLRQMGQEGKLTSQDVFKAIRSQSDKLKGELGKMPWTVGQATTKMANAYGKFLKRLEDSTGITERIAKGIAKLSEYIEHININNFVKGMKLVALYAGVLLTMSKWSLLVQMVFKIRFGVMALYNALKLAVGMQVVFNSQTKKGAALQVLAMGKFLLIAAAITLVILALQDFYKWVTDPTADTMLGRWVGSFNELKQKVIDWYNTISESPARFLPLISAVLLVINVVSALWQYFMEGKGVIADVIAFIKNAWESFCNAFSTFTNQSVGQTLKDIWGWLCKVSDKIAELARSFGVELKEKFSGPLWPTIKSGLDNVVNSSGPALSAAQLEAYSGKYLKGSDTNTNISNSGNQTNYITVNTGSNASPADIGAGVADGISRSNGGLGTAIDYSNPNFAY